MEVTLDGIVTEARELHEEKAYCPIDVTVEGILIDLSVAQP